MIAILYNIRSAHNVGSMFRTADAVGIEKIYLCGYSPAPINDLGQFRNDIHKTALGAEKLVEWDASARSAQAIIKLLGKLKKEKYKIFAIEQDKRSMSYYKLKANSSKLKACLVVGNELNGLPKSILNKCDKILEIPMRGSLSHEKFHPKKTKIGKESLNVSVAFGVVAFGITTNTRHTKKLKHSNTK